MQITLVENFFSKYRSIKKRKKSDFGLLFFNDKIFLPEKEFSGLDLDNLFLEQVLKEQACDQNSEFPPLLYHKEL
jgi:hypothetical protein